MIRKTMQAELRSNPSFGPFIRLEGNIVVDSGTREELKLRIAKAAIEVINRDYNHQIDLLVSGVDVGDEIRNELREALETEKVPLDHLWGSL